MNLLYTLTRGSSYTKNDGMERKAQRDFRESQRSEDDMDGDVMQLYAELPVWSAGVITTGNIKYSA